MPLFFLLASLDASQVALQLLLSALTSEVFWGVVVTGLLALFANFFQAKQGKRLQVVVECAGLAYSLTNAFKARTATKLDDYANVALENFLRAMRAKGYEPTLGEQQQAQLRMEALWGQEKTAQALAEKAAKAQVRELAAIGVGAALAPALASKGSTASTTTDSSPRPSTPPAAS